MNFLGFFFMYLYNHTSIHGVNFFQPKKKEKGGCPLMIPPRERKEAKQPFSDERNGIFFGGTG